MSFATLLARNLARAAVIAPAIARLKRNAARAVVGVALVAVLGSMGLAYLLVALRQQLEREIGPLWAPLLIGGALLLAALIAYLALLRPRRAAARSFEAKADAVPPELAASVRKLETKVARNPLPSLALALAAGFALAWLLRGRRRGGAEPRASSGGDAEPSAWTHKAPRREAERRKANGRGARAL